MKLLAHFRIVIMRLGFSAILILIAMASIVRANRILDQTKSKPETLAVKRHVKLRYEYSHFKLPSNAFLRTVRNRDFHLVGSNARERLASAQAFIQLHGALPNTPFMNYLRWRRSLNAARFDHYHPLIGPLLGEDAGSRSNSVNLDPLPLSDGPSGDPPIGIDGRPGGRSGPPPIDPPNASSVPEPASFALLGLGLAAFFGIRGRLMLLHETKS